MSCTAFLQHTLRIHEGDAFNSEARTTVHRVDTLRVAGALRHESQLVTLSAGVVNQEITLAPITASDPGSLLRVTTNQPLDIRINASNASMLSAVLQLVLGGSLSALFLGVPGPTPATVRIETMGGGSIAASTPAP